MKNIQLAQILALALSANALPSGAPAQREIQTWKERDPEKNKPHQGRKEMERRARKMKGGKHERAH